MFDEVTKGGGVRQAARRGGFVVGSTVLQICAVVAIVTVSAAIKAKVVDPEPVAVSFPKALAPAPPQPGPPPPPPLRKTAAVKRPQTRQPAPVQPLVQPKQIPPPEAPHAPDPVEPEDPGGAETEGVVGGVAGGSTQGVVGGMAGGPPPPVDDGPVEARAGFRKPQLSEAGCVQRSLRIPEEWLERLGLVTVKFAVGKDGAPSRFQSLSQGFAERAGPAIWRAVRSCRWIPGADDQGRTAAIWVVLPIRFTVE